MASGDILSCTIRADGWTCDVVIDGSGFATGATYDFGTLDDSPATTSSPTFSMTVVSEGYTSGVLGTRSRTIYGTEVVRVPYSTATIAGVYVSGTFTDGETVTQAVSGATAIVVGNQSAGSVLRVRTVTGTPNTVDIWSGATASFTASATPSTLPAPTKDEFDTGTTMTVRVALSDSVYADDKNGGAGTSGTNPTVTISAAWCTSGANTSNAATALACTNNSTLAYPNVIGQWAWGHTPAWQAVTSATSIGFIAYHGHGIDCVALSATDAHSNAVSGTATAKTAHQMSASSLYYESYDLTVPITGFTAGDDVTCRAIAYPLIGDAATIIDTNSNTTSTNDILGFNKITFRVSPTSTATIYVSSTGNDSTGDGSDGNPYLTIGKALSVVTDAAGKASTIYVKAGTLGILGSTPASVAATGCMITIAPKPGDSVTLNRGATFIAYKGTKVRYTGFTITGNNWLDGGNVASAKLWFDNCTIDPTTPNGTVGLGYRSEGCWFVNCAFPTRDDMDDGIVARVAYSVTGCSFSAGQILNANACTVASLVTGGAADKTRLLEKSSSTAPLTNNLLYANNKLMAIASSASRAVNFGSNQALTGIAFIGNVIESKSGTQAAVWFGADSSTTDLTNVILAHNTVAGERCNLFYNDSGTTANVRKNIFVRNNAFRSYNIKTDTFGTQSGNRVGNWAQVYGVNYSDNRYDGTVDSAYTNDFDGINVSFVNAKDTTYGQLGYTDDNSLDGDGTGNGDYAPTAGSVLKSHVLRQKYLTYNLLGNTV